MPAKKISVETDHAWVNAEEVKSYNCIDGIAEEVAMAIKIFKK
jgi:hypothetical protein